MVTSLDRPQLRALLNDTLRTDGDFNAFVLDYFPDVHRNFTGGMDRTSKLNLLLESVDGDDILRALIKWKPALAARLHIADASAPAAPGVTSPPVEKPSPASIDPVSLPASLASMPPPKYVLHLSDLHFSDETQADQWHAQLLLDLRNQMQIRELSAVIISGDITHHATIEQFGFAHNFLRQLCESFHIEKQRLIIVPGNHDVNWTLTDHGQDGFSPFAMFYQQLTGAAYPASVAAQTTLHNLADLKLLVLGLNTAWKIDRAHPSRAGLHAGAFGKAIKPLVNNKEYQKCNKLAVWHHPPAELTTEAGLDGAVLEQLAQAGFRLILHGHIHRADNALFRYYQQSNVGGLEILTAGTFGAPTHELVSGYPFQYQVLEFRGDILTVHTRKREKVAGGWIADHRWQQTPGQSPLASYQILLRTPTVDWWEHRKKSVDTNQANQNAYGPLLWITFGFFAFVVILFSVPMCLHFKSIQSSSEETKAIRNSADMRIWLNPITTQDDVSYALPTKQEHISKTESNIERKPNPEMIRIAGNRFQMGSDSERENESPLHQEQVASYWLDKTEVTVSDYASCVNAKKCSEPKTDRGCNWKIPARQNHPVNCIDWYQAKQFCNWLGLRLPTEIEWEYAARGANAKNNPDLQNGNVCWKRNEKQGTCSAGKSSSDISPLGVYDMAANVYEWVQDNYRLCYGKICSVNQYEKAVRGGAWSFPVPNLLRFSARNRHAPTEYSSSLGFRCAK
ncbi:MAG: SUMF1/EgtB/PvdO family nonheme iron enzyme [Myxococcales bacterium]|nr:SUMF1/EgtB/PvdO family nonheme iron enzyme [Myxococcales bacterium]